ncbi:MAG: helix-turn-helix domain-containing protein [Clostridia bacterium]|nr:helix-turn-helix domain-containing protein [Clostridia bacterium]
MDLKEFREIVAQNIYYLRTVNHMTQYELGQKLNYSDKAISKWERGDGVPDAYILTKISELFGVSVDYILTEHSEQDKRVDTKPAKVAKQTIMNISVISVFVLALLAFIIIALTFDVYYWQVFVYAVPIATICAIVFSSVWERARGVLAYTSILLWSLLATIYVAIGNYSYWLIFVLGIPLQAIVFLVLRLKITITVTKKLPKQKEEENQTQDEPKN